MARRNLNTNCQTKSLRFLYLTLAFITKQTLYISFFSIVILYGCKNSEWNGEWGATVGDCDEICTVYYTAQLELMKDRKLFDKNFPNEIERRKQVTKINNGHKIDSWFNSINNTDTIKNFFSCEVYYDKKNIRYVVDNLEVKEFNLKKETSKELEKDTITIELEYYGWGCPCPQWITKENISLYETKKDGDEYFQDLFINVRSANDSIPTPFKLTDDMENLKFEFKGQFYIEPQFTGEEGELGPSKTLLYYSIKHLK